MLHPLRRAGGDAASAGALLPSGIGGALLPSGITGDTGVRLAPRAAGGKDAGGGERGGGSLRAHPRHAAAARLEAR